MRLSFGDKMSQSLLCSPCSRSFVKIVFVYETSPLEPVISIGESRLDSIPGSPTIIGGKCNGLHT
jgi:hypothetical protein